MNSKASFTFKIIPLFVKVATVLRMFERIEKKLNNLKENCTKRERMKQKWEQYQIVIHKDWFICGTRPKIWRKREPN